MGCQQIRAETPLWWDEGVPWPETTRTSERQTWASATPPPSPSLSISLSLALYLSLSLALYLSFPTFPRAGLDSLKGPWDRAQGAAC